LKIVLKNLFYQEIMLRNIERKEKGKRKKEI